jgi:hypothetical protein
MRIRTLLLLSLLAARFPLLADKKSVDCGKGQDLNKALQNLSPGDALTFTGVCNQNVVITVSGITLTGQGAAAISSPSQANDALTISGAQRVTLQNFTVQNGNSGLHATGGAAITLQNITAQRNAVTGILVEGTSTAYVSGSASQNNGLDGVDVENTSSIIFNGDFAAGNNGVFGINLGATSSATVNAATVSANNNALGVQVSISSSWFLSNPAALVNTLNNLTVGFTVVSGAHLFSFGGSMVSSGNGLDGFDIASRAGVDFDAGSQISSFNNQRDGFHVEDMSMANLFNNPQFSGNPGFTTIQLYNNAGNGLSLLTNSRLNMFDQAKVLSHNNTGDGIQVDDGSNMNLLGSTIQNNPKDVVLTFGSRGDFSGNTIGSLTCDATSLIRGDTGKTCPTH